MTDKTKRDVKLFEKIRPHLLLILGMLLASGLLLSLAALGQGQQAAKELKELKAENVDLKKKLGKCKTTCTQSKAAFSPDYKVSEESVTCFDTRIACVNTHLFKCNVPTPYPVKLFLAGVI